MAAYTDFISIVKEYDETIKINAKVNKYTDNIELTINECSIITIFKDMTKEQLIKAIKSKLEHENSQCSICYTDYTKMKISCNRCHEPWCDECYVKLFISGFGVIKCPFCRHEVGNKCVSKDQLMFGIMNIANKVNNYRKPRDSN